MRNVPVLVRVWLTVSNREIRARLCLLILGAVAAIVLGFATFGAKQAAWFIGTWGYAIIAGTFAIWLVALWRIRPRSEVWRDWWRDGGSAALAACAAITACAVTTSPYVGKVNYDENVIQGTALAMHRYREVGSIARAYVYDGTLQVLQPYLDKRPYFFPFLVSLAHDLFGWREANAFVLNTALLPLVLLLVHAVARRMAGPRAGLAAIVSLGAFSLLLLNATGAGMEMLNLALVLGLVLLGALYLEAPDSGRQDALILTCILLANTRYESSVYVLSVAALVIVGWARAGRPIISAGALVAPWLLIPYALHNKYLSETPFLWELHEGLQYRFSFDYLQSNLASARRFFFGGGPEFLNSQWLSWVGFPALGFLSLRWMRARAKPSATGAACLAVGAGVAANLALLLAYYWGDLTDPIVARLSLPLHAMLAVAIGAAMVTLERVHGRRLLALAVVGAAGCYAAFGGRVTQNLADLNLIESSMRWELAVVRSLPPAERMIICEKSPLFWFMQGMGGTSCLRAAQKQDGLAYHWRARSFQEILVTQRLTPASAEGGWTIEWDSRLPDGFVLETLAERRFGAKLQRVSRVVDIRAASVAPPAARGEQSVVTSVSMPTIPADVSDSF